MRECFRNHIQWSSPSLGDLDICGTHQPASIHRSFAEYPEIQTLEISQGTNCLKYQIENMAKIENTTLFTHSLIIKDDWNTIKNQM